MDQRLGVSIRVDQRATTKRYHRRAVHFSDSQAGLLKCRAKNRAASSPANDGTPVWPPRFACSVFSLEPKASKRSNAICRLSPWSSHCSSTCKGIL
ncbi:hypothetical protein MIPYR_20256 [uncultured Microbacterium sp.]|uniref:Uncharacterized protein n=1 Tax=uncultured Microbacterium sp. TaxID=191216 RepID=A0A1Y5P3E8_9MICO|nr:hypothetical protein MIPYR_20256 [uncultured Microbacterium sp.]